MTRKKRLYHTLEYFTRTIIAAKYPISAILRNSIDQYQNNNLNNHANYASDLNIVFYKSAQLPTFWTASMDPNQFIYFDLKNIFGCALVNWVLSLEWNDSQLLFVLKYWKRRPYIWMFHQWNYHIDNHRI